MEDEAKDAWGSTIEVRGKKFCDKDLVSCFRLWENSRTLRAGVTWASAVWILSGGPEVPTALHNPVWILATTLSTSLAAACHPVTRQVLPNEKEKGMHE